MTSLFLYFEKEDMDDEQGRCESAFLLCILLTSKGARLTGNTNRMNASSALYDANTIDPGSYRPAQTRERELTLVFQA